MDVRRRVLLADANEEFRALLRKAIDQTEAFAVAGVAGGAAETLELTEQLRPELLVLDVVLPGDGLTVLKHHSAEKTNEFVLFCFHFHYLCS